jgi:RimJ/RimL family protein N-acetyltransferase
VTGTALPAPPVLADGPDLRLRRHRPQDVDAIVEQCQDPETVRSTTVPVPYARSDAEGFLQHVAAGWSDGTTAAFAIEAGGRFAGSTDLRLADGDWAEIGFGLAPWARGRGLMTRATALVVDWGFTELGLAGIQWRAVVGNAASLRVAQKVGFTLEGTVRGLLVHRGERLDGWIGTLLATDPRRATG